MKTRISLILTAIFLSFTIFPAFAQDKVKKNQFSLNACYPIPIGYDFVNKSYTKGYLGLFSVEIGYAHSFFYNIFTGINLELDHLYLDSANIDLEIFKPSLSIGYPIKLSKLVITPQVNIGYSLWRYYSKYVTGTKTDLDSNSYYESNNGISIGGTIYFSYPVYRNISINLSFRYEYTHLSVPSNATYTSRYYQDIQMIYPGLGLMMKW
jgi:hypothetical protein